MSKVSIDEEYYSKQECDLLKQEARELTARITSYVKYLHTSKQGNNEKN